MIMNRPPLELRSLALYAALPELVADSAAATVSVVRSFNLLFQFPCELLPSSCVPIFRTFPALLAVSTYSPVISSAGNHLPVLSLALYSE